jgi:hypothetical protein
VSIEAKLPDGQWKSVGTGFLVRSSNNHVMLVTAKHVVMQDDGKVLANLGYRLNSKEGEATMITDAHATAVAKSAWFFSTNADVACRFIVWGDKAVVRTIARSQFLTSEHLQTTTPLLILAFPMGLRSAEHSVAIARSGMVARRDKSGIIAEGFVFPGNSGGPVLYMPVFPVDQKTLLSPVLQGQWLVGLVSSQISYVDVAVSLQTRKPRVTFEDNAGLVNIVGSDDILQLLDRKDVTNADTRIGN